MSAPAVSEGAATLSKRLNSRTHASASRRSARANSSPATFALLRRPGSRSTLGRLSRATRSATSSRLRGTPVLLEEIGRGERVRDQLELLVHVDPGLSQPQAKADRER